MPVSGLSEISNLISDTGGFIYSTVYKPTIPASGFGDTWIDASMSSGIPKFNAYAGSQYEATQMFGSGNNGIYSGESDSLREKRLVTWGSTATTAALPLYLVMLDYLMFYSLIDLDSTDQQDMINNVTIPRYTDGVGVKLMVVCTVGSSAAADMEIEYVNNFDQVKTVTQRIILGATGSIMTALNPLVVITAGTPFVNLSSGDLGVKSVNRVTMLTPAGGFCALVLVKPIAHKALYEQTYNELTFVNDKMTMPRIYDGAYLNIITRNQTPGATNLRSDILFTQG